MAYKSCPNCGERVYSRGCTNCNEAAYISQQYDELGKPTPDSVEKEIKRTNCNCTECQWMWQNKP